MDNSSEYGTRRTKISAHELGPSVFNTIEEHSKAEFIEEEEFESDVSNSRNTIKIKQSHLSSFKKHIHNDHDDSHEFHSDEEHSHF